MKKFTGIVLILAALLQMSSAATNTLVQSVTYDGETITMRLTKENLRGSNFELWSQNATGGYDVITPVTERSYMGSVDEYPDAVSCGILKDDGTFKGAVYFDRGATWFTEGSSVVFTRGLDAGPFRNFSLPSAPVVAPGQVGSTMYAFDLGVDVDYNYFTDAGSDVATVLEGIEYSVCLTRAIYMRDVLLRPYLARVIVRATLAHDPYTGTSDIDYLRAVGNEWKNNHKDADRDLVAGVSPTKIGGGLAWPGTIGQGGLEYSVSQSGGSGNFDVVFRHEMGHNWGCGHYVGGSPEGTGIMGGNGPGRFSGCEVWAIMDQRDVITLPAGGLTNEGTYTAIELPPYAGMDVGALVQDVSISATLNVLANDNDANGQALSLHSFDSMSKYGGSITQDGQNLVYTAPGAFGGVDNFTYTITDTMGRTATGAVVIDVTPPSKAGRLYLPLDETSGVTAADSSSYSLSGTLANTDFTTSSIAGKYGNALNLNGTDEHISVSGVEVGTDTVTITAWIKPTASQASFAGLVFDRSGSASGLNISTGRELRYHWNNSSTSYGWSSGLIPPADAWTFVALVIEPTRATMYMDSGSGFQSATNNAAHAAATFGTTYIGTDPGQTSRHFSGAIDEVRIYSQALSQSELQNVADGGSTGDPAPSDGAVNIVHREMSWLSQAAATGFEVYIGTNQAAVTAADTGSAEYQGATVSPEWTHDFQTNTTYYWRVDTLTATGTVSGAVWSFTTGGQIFESDLVAHWALDEGSGSFAVDSSINNKNGVRNGATWANGLDNGALLFDGVDDSVTFGTGPSLDGPTDFTLSAWVKTSAATEQVILQQRDGGSTGYNGTYVLKVLANGTVHFAINNGGQQFSFATSATVNDGQWHYVSAVRDGENGHIYIDGNPVAAASGSGAIRNLVGSVAVALGRNIRGNNTVFNGLIDEVKIYSIAKSGQDLTDSYNSYISGPIAPEWGASLINEIAATEGVAYNSTLADDAGDLNGDPLTFSKVSGPAWLNVATNGELSGTPSSAYLGANNWVVEVTDGNTPPIQASLAIVVADDSSLFSDDFERTAGSSIGNGWIEQSSDSRTYDTSNTATKMVISVSAGTSFSILNQLSATYTEGADYEMTWNASRAASGDGTLNYNVSIGTWDGATFTPLATQSASIANLNIMGKVAGPAVNATATASESGQQIAIRFEVVSGSSDWTGFDDIEVTVQPDNDSDGLTDVLDPDDDNDGIPDIWEGDHSLNHLLNDKTLDPDNDGKDNWFEYVADTDPQDPDSKQAFSIESDSSTGEPKLRFSTSANRKYTVQYSDDLSPGSWLPLTLASPGTGSEMSVKDTTFTSSRFYRLLTELP